MRKTSHDGGDSTSITSGFENETRKSSVGIIKTKRNSIKRKVQNFSHESDDTVIEPLLQIDKTETINRSAKYLLSKSKTDSLNERDNKMCSDNKFEKQTVSKPVYSTGTTCNSNLTIHNHMNTNVFGGHDGPKLIGAVKSPILVEINGAKASGNSNQSIFTTAKIHTDSITKTMTPVQVTPLPILSTVEGNIVKAGISHDYSQTKNVEPSTSSNSSKSINCHSRSDISKSVPSTEPILKNISTDLDSRLLESTKKTESKFLNNSGDLQKIKVTSESIKDSVIGNIAVPPISSGNTTLDRKSKPSQEQHDLGVIDSFRIRDTESKINSKDSVTSSIQNKSDVKPIVPKDYGLTKKEDNILSSTGGSIKQLQRQKNTIVEDPRDADNHFKNVSELNKFSSSTQKDLIAKGISTIIADVEEKQLSSTSLPKCKENVTQSIPIKSDSANVAGIHSKQMSTAITINNTPLVSKLSKELGVKSSVQSIHAGSMPIKADLTKSTTLLQNQISKPDVGNTSNSVGSAKEVVSKSCVSVQPLQVITSLKSNIVKDIQGGSSLRQKPTTDKSSLSTNNKIISKPPVSVQPIQTTASFKSDVKNKDTDAGSSRFVKSGKESSSITSTISKDGAPKSTITVQPSQPLSKIKSDSVKGKELETDNITKAAGPVSSSAIPVKLPVTTNSSSLIKGHSTKILETTPVPKSVTTKAHTTLSDNKHSKSPVDSEPNKIDKTEITNNPSGKTITTNSSLPSSNIVASKSDTTPKVSSSIPSCPKPVVCPSETQLGTKTTSGASPLSSSNTPNSTVAKSPTLTKQCSKPKSTEKNGKI